MKRRIHYLFVIAIKKKKRIIPDKPNQTLRNKKSEVSSSWTMERILRNIPALGTTAAVSVNICWLAAGRKMSKDESSAQPKGTKESMC